VFLSLIVIVQTFQQPDVEDPLVVQSLYALAQPEVLVKRKRIKYTAIVPKLHTRPVFRIDAEDNMDKKGQVKETLWRE
jgi:hypothetical protein